MTFYINSNQINGQEIRISGDDFHHIRNVLRLKPGESFHVCDEKQNRYNVTISKYLEGICCLNIKQKLDYTTELPVGITLYQGLPKQDKMEFIIQKATELGVKDIIPVAMGRSVVKLSKEEADKKVVRWQKIAKEASSQSGRQQIPHVFSPINFKNIIENIEKYDIVLLLYENEERRSLKQCITKYKRYINDLKNIAIVIGPEGGFTNSEIESIKGLTKVKTVTIGKRILRTETAGISAISMLSYEFEQ